MFQFLNDIPSYVIITLEVLYLIGIVLLSAKIIIDTKTTSKTLAYLLLIVFLPIFGIIFYFVFGVNYRKNKFYNFKVERNERLYAKMKNKIGEHHNQVLQHAPIEVKGFQNVINFLYYSLHSPITAGNHVELLVNGEQKFPKVFEILEQAKHHIHLEYYIFNSDDIGHRLAETLIRKAQEGVVVRFLYDDFGSRKIGRDFLSKLQAGGVQTSPVNKIKFKVFANRVNYRDHRKIIIVDGEHVFSGGINVADKNINPNSIIYWRDTHFYMRGQGVFYFQYLFMTSWISSTKKIIADEAKYFQVDSKSIDLQFDTGKTVQVAASGPDIRPAILLSTLSVIYEAKERIYITTPYFVPVESILQAMKTQALAGLDVRLLVPRRGDSRLVNAAAYSYYEELLRDGVKIYFYDKGFIHSKTMLVDNHFATIGTANMDVRSQELNFEVNTNFYDRSINQKLYELFMKDIEDSQEIYYEEWLTRSRPKVFFEHLARLFSPLL